jgi:hypothetical protein
MKKFKSLTYRAFLLVPEHKILSCTFLGLTVVAAGLLALTDKSDSKSTLMMSRLNVLQTNIAALQKTANKPVAGIDLSSMTQQVQQLSQQLEKVRSQNTNHFDQALNQTEDALSKQLDTIQRLVVTLDKQKTSIKFLPAKYLPFQVLSIDSIQHVPVASVTYDFKTVPLEKGDSLAGWRVISIDYGKQRIEFENARKERVLLTQEQISHA